MLRLLAVVPSIYDTSPGQRFRIEQWEPILRENGIEITHVSFEDEELHRTISKPGATGRKIRLVTDGLMRRIKHWQSIKNYDAVYVFREAALIGPAIFERLIKRSGVPMIFDFDDAVFLPQEGSVNKWFARLRFPQKTAKACQFSSHVMAGNEYLGDFARQFNQNVTIVPTTIDTEKYTFDENKPDSAVTVVGWSGSYSTLQYLDTLRGAFQDLAREENFRLLVIGTPDKYQIEGVAVEAMPWRSASEVEDLRRIDIGLMPLPDTEWTKGKCGLKALQYMALGIPTICSPVGVNSSIIHDGENGLLASTKDEWIAKIKLLLRSAETRRKLGSAGRKTVENGFSAEAQAPRVQQIIESVVK